MKLVIVFLVIIAVIILFVLTNIRIVPQSKAFVIERLGAYFATWETGLHVKVPFIDRIAKTVLCLESWKITVPSKSMQIKMRTDVKTDTHFLHSKTL